MLGLTLLFIVSVAFPAAAELTQPLTSEDVACNERQLEKLLQRMSAGKERYSPLPQLPTILLVSYSNSVGFYDGLVSTDQNFRLDVGGIPPVRAYEHYLAFNLNPSIRTLLLNPSRPELAQVSLNREQSSSNLVNPGGYFDLTLKLNPTLGGGDSLVINNFAEPAVGEIYNGFLSNSTKPGRGLIADGLLTPCHQKLTDFDRHMFAVLQRMVRGGEAAFFQPDSEFSIFRGENPLTYRVNFYPIHQNFQPGGKIAVELVLSPPIAGRLTSGVLRALPPCAFNGQLGCTSFQNIEPIVFLIRPLLGGAELYPGDAEENGIIWTAADQPSPPVTIDLEALLAHTTWNEPAW